MTYLNLKSEFKTEYNSHKSIIIVEIYNLNKPLNYINKKNIL